MTRKEKAKELRLFIYHIFSDGESHSVEEVAERAKISYDKAAGMLYGFTFGSRIARVWRDDDVISYRQIASYDERRNRMEKKITIGKDNSNPCVHRFNDIKYARAFAKANGAKVEYTGNSFMKYAVVIAGKGIRPWEDKK